ncbi:hypothetical protein [Paenibacillus donghaensis]|nr:hypothetical protein [Paenibacillus donghaensis]
MIVESDHESRQTLEEMVEWSTLHARYASSAAPHPRNPFHCWKEASAKNK